MGVADEVHNCLDSQHDEEKYGNEPCAGEDVYSESQGKGISSAHEGKTFAEEAEPVSYGAETDCTAEGKAHLVWKKEKGGGRADNPEAKGETRAKA